MASPLKDSLFPYKGGMLIMRDIGDIKMVTGNGFAARSKQRGLDALLNVIIYPAPDLEGQWIAHCLETDMIVQADSDHDAFEAMAESIEAIAKHNVSKGRPAIEYRSAPPEVFAMFKESEDLAIRILHIPAETITNEITLSSHLVSELAVGAC